MLSQRAAATPTATQASDALGCIGWLAAICEQPTFLTPAAQYWMRLAPLYHLRNGTEEKQQKQQKAGDKQAGKQRKVNAS
jgi:hypothetical protein